MIKKIEDLSNKTDHYNLIYENNYGKEVNLSEIDRNIKNLIKGGKKSEEQKETLANIN